MPRPKVLDRSPVQVLLDNCGRDVRLPSDRRCVSESRRNTPHDRGYRPLLLAFRAPRTVALRVPLADALGRTGSPAAAEVLAAAMPAASVDLRVRIVRGTASSAWWS